jgi:hypothetical protein
VPDTDEVRVLEADREAEAEPLVDTEGVTL